MGSTTSPSNSSLISLAKYGKNSLRSLAPSWWETGEQTIKIRSIIESYSIGPIEKDVGVKRAQFIRENCRSARRLRNMSICAYESLAAPVWLPDWSGIGAMTFLALASGISMLDAIACALWGVLFKKDPPTEQLPDLKKLLTELKKLKHPFEKTVSDLLNADWSKSLREARNSMVHRGFWPAFNEADGFHLYQMLEAKFEFGSRLNPPAKKQGPPLDLAKIMRGILCDFEAWDLALECLLEKQTDIHKPYVNGSTTFQFIVDGSPQTDWSLGAETAQYCPNEELAKKWEEFSKSQQT